jgi:hypothetical protein
VLEVNGCCSRGSFPGDSAYRGTAAAHPDVALHADDVM